MRSLVILAALAGCVVVAAAAGHMGDARAASGAAASEVTSLPPEFVQDSTRFTCWLTGVGQETATADDYGMKGADLGYSVQFDGGLWWLFGDTHATADFPKGTTTPNSGERWPQSEASLDNDSVADSTSGPPGRCPQLRFVAQGSSDPTPGAYASPSVAPDPLARSAQVSLRTNETPLAAIVVKGVMYATFQTDNIDDVHPVQGCTSASCRGRSTRSVMAALTNPATLGFTGLYDLSAPAVRYGQGAKFVSNAIEPAVGCHLAAPGLGCYLYIWGVEGGRSFGQSAPYLARIPAVDIATGAGLEYFAGTRSDGVPEFESSEAAAVALFHDTPSDCMSYVASQYNPYLGRWIMIYDCGSGGIYMRTAPQPWGPWSERQQIFNPAPNPKARTGDCYFLRSPGPCPKHAPLQPKPGAQSGHGYAPYFIAGWTTGHPASATVAAESTFYYTISTLNPYGEVIVRSTIQGPPPSKRQGKPPGCTPGPHGTCV